MNTTSGRHEKRVVATTSVLAAVFLTSMKLVVGIATNSLGILSEAAHSGLDLLAALITLLAITIADKPADREHQYGHGKVENLSALIETLLLVVTCGWIIWEAVDRLVYRAPHIETTVWSFVVLIVSIIVDLSRSRALTRVARKHHSQALEADALHFSSDVWSSATVLVGLGFVSLGYPFVDSVVALIVSFLVLGVSYRLGRRTLDALMDRISPELTENVRREILGVKGVEGIRSLRLRLSGSTMFVDAIVFLPRTIPFDHAHRIMDDIERAVVDLHPKVDVVVHAEPLESSNETLVDKVRMIVLARGLRPPHNLEVQLSNGKCYVDFDLEYPRGKSFTSAHELTTEIERQIQRDLPDVGKVTIHMEEFHPRESSPHDVTDSEPLLCSGIQSAVARDRRVLDCSDITVLQEGESYSASLTCHIDRSRTLEDVHRIVTDLEAGLYQQFRRLRRVTIHAEPQ